MSVIDTLLNWIAPFLDPMNNFHIYANDMNNVHSGSVHSFRELVYKLDPNQALQQNTILSGNFTNALQNSAEDYTQTELDISEMVVMTNKLAQITEDFVDCVSNIMEAIEMASVKLEGDEALTEITADVDIAAVAEGGFNPIADIMGIILTIIDGAILIDTIKELADDIQRDMQALSRDLNALENATYPPTAPQPYTGTIQPTWQKNPKKVNPADLAALQQLYGGTFAANANFTTIMTDLLQMGLTKDQIVQIMNQLLATGCSPTDILLFLQGLLNSDGANPHSPTPDQIVARIQSLYNGMLKNPPDPQNLKDLVTLYAQIADKPGASRLLERLMTASFGPSYKGYLFELQWCVDHKDKIARIEDIDEDRQQAADVVMNSGPFTLGAVVDTKNYQLNSLQSDQNNILSQIQRDKTNYPGYPVVLVFNSQRDLFGPDGKILPSVDAIFKKFAAEGATVMTSPPDTVWEVGQQNLPSAGTNPGQLLQSGARLAGGLLTGGQDPASPQLPPPTTPPQIP